MLTLLSNLLLKLVDSALEQGISGHYKYSKWLNVCLYKEKDMKGSGLLAGLTGSTLLTATHQVIRHSVKDAPRMDLLGMEALSKLLKAFGLSIPGHRKLFLYTMAGDLIGNGLYFNAGRWISRKNTVTLTIILGIVAGIGAVTLPKYLGLNNPASSRTIRTRLITIGLYTLAGVASALSGKMLDREK